MPDATLLAFDFGLQRIGVAIGELRLGQARALSCIQKEDNTARFAAIGELIREWQPTRLVVGSPRHEDGSPHDMTARCTRFANQLRGRFALPVDEIDERFSSLEADAALREPLNPMDTPSRQRRHSWQERKAAIDAEAARIILQSWLDHHAAQTHEIAEK
ncbi:MAG: Holliday junction resolvase RuvX [Rugosibacter sp.]